MLDLDHLPLASATALAARRALRAPGGFAPEDVFLTIGAVVGATVAVLALYPAMRRLVNALANLYFQSTAMKKAVTLRQPQGGQQVRVRQTDLVARMSREDRQRYRQAELLLSQGKVLEAARLFEAIRFQRRAIDELEKAKLVDEACAVLVRMNVPNRAAVIYERNGMLEKAAHWFGVAKQPEGAAKCYLKLGVADWRCLEKAAQAFEAAGKSKESLETWARLNATDRVVTLARQQKLYGALAEYMADPTSAREALRRLDEPALREFLHELSECPRSARLLAAWCAVENDAARRAAMAARATAREELAAVFIAALEPEIAARLEAEREDVEGLSRAASS